MNKMKTSITCTADNQLLLDKINPSLRTHIPMDRLVEDTRQPAEKLLTNKRFDIVAKYVYGKYREAGGDGDWHKRLYLEHIRVFNGFFEKDGSGKCGEDGFLDSFNNLLDSIKCTGFDDSLSVVPLCRDYSVYEGAHRTAACLLYNKELHYVRFDIESIAYDYEWFRKKGLDEKWLDAIASELCRINKNSFIVVIYPSAVGLDEELTDLVKKYGNIWYRKSVHLKNNGPLNLVRQIYWNEPWLGNWKDGFGGAQNKANWCFQNNEPVRVFVVESDLERMIELKKQIRDLYKVENHSVHINDTHEETLQLARLLLNNNSIHFMNHSTITERKWFNRLFFHYKKWIEENGLDKERFCIDGSAVLAAYGIRESRDIDFLHLDREVETGFKEISSHNLEAKYYDNTVTDIITNPENFFYYNDMKFASVDVIRTMKKKRGEDKDVEDLRLIDELLHDGHINQSVTFIKKLRRLLSPRYVYQRTRFAALQVRFMLSVIKIKYRTNK